LPLDAEHERRLIEQARHEPEAFRELYRYYFARVYAYVAYRVGRAGDAEDLTAEIFLKIVESLSQFEYRGEGAFAAWVFRIAHNAISQFYRQQHSETVSLDDLPDIQSDDLAPDEIFLRKERFQRLRAHIAILSPRRQEIITLRFFGGLRNQEIAAVLKLDERTVAAHLCRAIEDLQRHYEAESIKKPE
jgi:RNA polymerase sigma factor (sigma-70 family)